MKAMKAGKKATKAMKAATKTPPKKTQTNTKAMKAATKTPPMKAIKSQKKKLNNEVWVDINTKGISEILMQIWTDKCKEQIYYKYFQHTG